MTTLNHHRTYADYVNQKAIRASPCGIEPGKVHPRLFPFQASIVRWACRRGRAAIWADTGLGKTLMQLEWARQIGGRTLILAPLAVSHQTAEEAKSLGLPLKYIRGPEEWTNQDIERVAITNYERLDAFTWTALDAVVLDESSILKSFDGATRRKLIERFADVPYRLACTATPAPNDYLELGNHAQFLGIMSWAEMAATFFVHDAQSEENGDRGPGSGAWRLKGHAEAEFWRWLVSWGVFVREPSDVGHAEDDARFKLPSLEIQERVIPTTVVPEGYLFFTGLKGIQDRSRVRKATLEERVSAAAELIRAEPKDQWLAWCGLNDEADALESAVPKSVQVRGSDEPETKAEQLLAFAAGKIRVLITKPRIAGYGMNFQRCARQVFVGLGDSYEQYYQCIRRSWRFGQKQDVKVWVVVSDLEEAIVRNIKRKEEEADHMAAKMVSEMRELETAEVCGADKREDPYHEASESGEGWTMYLGDCVEVLRKSIPDDTVDLSVYSPPFVSLYTYTASPRDMGNCKDEDAFFEGFRFFAEELLRATKPGRLTACHVAQLAAMASRDGYIGIKDFRGRVIDTFKATGWIHHGEVCIDKNPQSQAIRTKSKALLFVQLRKDSSWLRPAISDFVLLFRKPGENATPIHPDISNEDWIKWAHPVWTDIRETEVLQYRHAREDRDEKHICPLQLDVIERCVRLWSNIGETVLSPFGGIGSEGHVSLTHGRRFVGIELKESYWRTACQTLAAAETEAKSKRLL